MSRRLCQPLDQPDGVLRLGHVGFAGEGRDQHRVRARHRDVGRAVAEAGGINQHHVGALASGMDQVRQPCLVGFRLHREKRGALVGPAGPAQEGTGWIRINGGDLQSVMCQPAGKQHGDGRLAGAALAAGNGQDSHD